MVLRRHILMIVLWLASLVAVGVYAQGRQAQPQIISGNDLGFRVDSSRGDTLTGALVVRVNGQWVEVTFGPKGRPAAR